MDYMKSYDTFCSWYDQYAASFTSSSEELREAVLLKVDHTRRVCRESEELCESLSLAKPILFMAKTTALFHDLGRFEQFEEYGTFQDRKSVNHSRLALQIIDRYNVFGELPENFSNMIKTAILHHNAKTIPSELPDDQKLLCHLIRDADKLDIFYMSAEHYGDHNTMQREILETGLPDLPTISPEICQSVLQCTIGDFSHIRCINDFKLIQLGWVYDMNIIRSFQLIRDRGHFDIIKSDLPDLPEVKKAVGQAELYLNKRAKGQ